QPVIKTDRLFRFEGSFLNQIHDGGRESDEKRGISEKYERGVEKNPISSKYRRNRRRRIIKKIRHKRHDEDQRKSENTQRSNTIFGVRNQKTQRRQSAQK